MYKYTSCGLDNIQLKNGFDLYESEEGTGVAIHDIDGLHRLIAKDIVAQQAPLSGKQFRFLRIEMDFSQKAVGGLMGKSDQTIALWEKGDDSIPVLADKAMRDLYMESIGESPIAGLLEELKDLDRQYHELQLEKTEHGWEIDICA